jgi:Predicted AAA-ATPase/PD-(D/E)XK nuclease superfamily
VKHLSASVYTFETLIKGNYRYIDKTEYMWKLLEQPLGIYFLSRPRRFGKSLTISTLKAVFQNKKHLFKGLALENKPYDWQEYPVIHLDLGGCDASSAENLTQYLIEILAHIAERHEVILTRTGLPSRFMELIEKMSIKGKVVILIDEYDKPILENITKSEIESIRDVLDGFYAVIKTTEPYQRFVFMTGVSKFSKVSVFSKLNNMTDITMDSRYATMFGYTQQELENELSDEVDNVAHILNIERDLLLDKIKLWYNGYRFHQYAETVYNPTSIAKFFESGGEFKNFWFETGTPTFLIKLMKQNDYDIESLENLEMDEIGFSAYEIDNLAIEPLLFQTGYITIKDYDPEFASYTLSYPNMEVKNAFMRFLMDAFTPVRKELAASHLMALVKALRKHDIDEFMERMKVFFANVPNNITLKHEKYYQTIFYLVLTLVGVYIEVEVNSNIGRIDAVMETADQIYIIEFKLNDSAATAMQQIKTKKYYEKYLNTGKELILVGAAFEQQTRNLGEWLVEPLSQK